MRKRGQILLIFGLVWIGIGVNVLHDGDPATWAKLEPFQAFSPVMRGWAWIVTGAVAVAYSVRPRIIHHDGLGFLALYIMPAWRVAAFVWSWLDGLLPLGGEGYPRGYLWALTYGCMVAAVMICASWPDPPRSDDRQSR